MLNTLSKNVTIFKDCLFDFFLNIYLVMLTCMNETESSIGALLVRVVNILCGSAFLGVYKLLK